MLGSVWEKGNRNQRNQVLKDELKHIKHFKNLFEQKLFKSGMSNLGDRGAEELHEMNDFHKQKVEGQRK